MIFYATGEGITTPPSVTGRPGTGQAVPAAPVACTIGGQTAQLRYAGQPQGLVGVIQINARVPAELPPGPAAAVLTIGGQSSQEGVTVAVR